MQNRVYVPRQVIEEHFITSCNDCKFVRFHFAAPSTCAHENFIESETNRLPPSGAIPDNCPRLNANSFDDLEYQVVEPHKQQTLHIVINAFKGTGKSFLANNLARLFDLHNIQFSITESNGHTTTTPTVKPQLWGEVLERFKRKRDIFKETLNQVNIIERQLVRRTIDDEPIFSKNKWGNPAENTIMVSVVGRSGVGKSTVMCLIQHELELLHIPHTTSYLDHPFYISRQEAIRRIRDMPISVNIQVQEYTPNVTSL